MRVLRGVVGVLACVALGAVVGVLGSFHQQSDLTLGSTAIPIGAVLGIVALVLAQLIARDAGPLRLGPAIVLLAWTLVVAVLGTTTSAGDLAVPANAAGSGFLYGGFLVGVAFAATSAVRGVAPRAKGGPATGGRPPGR